MSAEKNKFFIGQEIEVDHELVRKLWFEKPNDFGFSKRLKSWDKKPFKQPKKAIVLGIRTLSNGWTSFDSEIGHMYTPTHYFRALLVVSNINNSTYFVEIKS